MKIAVIPGSFNPPTLGHLNIIERACRIFDMVYVVAMINENKKTDFTMDESYEMLKLIGAKFQNLAVEKYSGMLYEYVLSKKADAIVKGIRSENDLQYEKNMAKYNKYKSGVDTLLLMADEKYSDISSTKVREMVKNGQDISFLVPDEILDIILKKYGK